MRSFCFSNLLHLSIILWLVSIGTTGALAQETIGRWSDGPTLAVAATTADRLVFSSGSTVKLADVKDPSAPVLIGNGVQVDDTVRALAVDNDKLLVAAGSAGIYGGSTAAGLSIPNPPFPTPGYAWDVVIEGNLAYVAAGLGGLRILDATSTGSLAELGSVGVGGEARAVAIDGSTAYVATGDNGLVTIDITSSASPMVLGSTSDIFGPHFDVVVSGSRAYLASSSSGVKVANVANLSQPDTFNTLARVTFDAHALALDGDRLYVADGQAGLAVYDLSDPDRPVWLKGHFVPDAQQLILSADRVWVAAGAAGLSSIERTSSANISKLGSWEEGEIGEQRVSSMAMSGQLAILGISSFSMFSSGWTVQLVDISDPTQLTPSESFDFSGTADSFISLLDVEVVSPYLYVQDNWNGFQIWEALSPSPPSLVGTCSSCGGDVMEKSGDKIFQFLFALNTTRLTTIDFSTPATPSDDNVLDLPTGANKSDVDGTLGFLAADDSLRVLDLADSSDPEEIGSIDLKGTPLNVHSAGTTALVGTKDAGVRIIDLTDPAQPAELGGYRPAAGREIVETLTIPALIPPPVAELGGGIATAAISSQGTWWLDISNPTFPRSLAYSPHQSTAIEVDGNIAYIGHRQAEAPFSGDTSAGMDTLDLSTLNTLPVDGNLPAAGPVRSMAAEAAASVLIAAESGGLEVVDLSFKNVSSPLLSKLNTGGRAHDVARSGQLALVAEGTRGLVIVDVSDRTLPVETGVYFDVLGEARLIAADGNVAYLATSNRVSSNNIEWTLTSIDISTPSAPTFIGSLSGSGGEPTDLQIAQDHAWLTVEGEGLQVIDVQNPAIPVQVDDREFQDARAVRIVDDLALVAIGELGLAILDISIPASVGTHAVIDTPGLAQAVAVDGTTAYVADGLGGLQIIGFADPTKPMITGAIPITGNAQAVELSKGRIFVSSGEAGVTTLTVPGFLFADDFESGNVDAWSLIFP